MGDNKGNIAGSQKDVKIDITNISKGDMEALRSYLTDLGINKTDIDNLKTAIKADQDDPSTKPKALGKCVLEWVGKLSSDISTGVLTNLSIDAVPQIIAAIQQYLP